MIFNRSVPCSPEEVPEREGGKVKRSVRWNPNRESLYCLLLLVRVVRVVRGSWNLKGSVPCSPLNFPRRERSPFPPKKWSVRCIFNRETRENREQKRECPL